MNLLVLSSVYPPDAAAVGQHLADVAGGASARGHRVHVITADRGYDDPSIHYVSHERRQGVDVVRLKWSSFGKNSYAARILSQISFTLQSTLKALLMERPDIVLVSTIPPFGILAALAMARLRRSSLIYWVMDINPDEAIAMRLVSPRSVSARLMEFINRVVLRSAATVITLDSQMAARLESKAEMRRPIEIIPPWPHQAGIVSSRDSGRLFRKEHGLEDKFVVMYSGNHSWVHPLDTILGAAKSLAYRKDILFLFIGGGIEKYKVEQEIKNGSSNILSLPYQPFDDLGESLSAADVHLVVMGDAMIGIVHPCKIYTAMAVGRPILAIAPDGSYISEVMGQQPVGPRFRHGDVAGVAQGLLALAEMNEEERGRLGENASCLARELYGQELLRNHFVDLLELAARSDG